MTYILKKEEKMKNLKVLKLIFLFSLTLGLNSCSEKDNNEMKKINLQKEICKRCNMLITNKHFAVEIINKKTHKTHMFDDLGCAVLWFKEENKNWFNEATIWIADAKNANFINAREALYTKDNLTPMGYGLNAYKKENLPLKKEVLSFEKAVQNIYKQDEIYQKRKEEVLRQRAAKKEK